MHRSGPSSNLRAVGGGLWRVSGWGGRGAWTASPGTPGKGGCLRSSCKRAGGQGKESICMMCPASDPAWLCPPRAQQQPQTLLATGIWGANGLGPRRQPPRSDVSSPSVALGGPSYHRPGWARGLSPRPGTSSLPVLGELHPASCAFQRPLVGAYRLHQALIPSLSHPPLLTVVIFSWIQ